MTAFVDDFVGAAADLADTLRFPKEPYPGLRPFLDYEAALLYGREKQVGEVLGHLERSQFVAVIGGSGSGKSSLVRAGVVPALRTYGIARAGSFWIPMVCTPGTNSAERAAEEGERDTPLRRFAWKFSKLLTPAPEGKADERIEDIVNLMRRHRGFSRVIDAYADSILPRPGLEGKDARFLLVIDQFEELFHPTNRDAEGTATGETSGPLIADARLLVERIIDHFYSPHERCYVVLTMRSEHLNDCAGFLELPDAINDASYLVRRLDAEQLRQAVIEPAGAYLRVRERMAKEGERLPANISFDEDLLERLLADTQAIAPDPDHLPLLQHLLSRTWDAALSRCPTGTLPERIKLVDLACAVRATPGASPSDLRSDENVLRSCLVAHAESIYASRKEPQAGAVDDMLRALAFKDPNTGLYSQQRINITADNQKHYAALVKQGFIGQVNYLFWDKENPARVTLKVSHESFIRGWPRFQKLVDREAERFEEFMQLLRSCARWLDADRREDMLMEGAQMRNFKEARLAEVLGDPGRRDRWFSFLSFARDGQRYRALRPELGDFIKRSEQREENRRADAAAAEKRERDLRLAEATQRAEKEAMAQRHAAELEREEKLRLAADLDASRVRETLAVNKLQAKRQKVRFWGLSLLFVVVLPASAFWLTVERPMRERLDDFIKTQKMSRNIDIQLQGSNVVYAQKQLTTALATVDQLGEALSKNNAHNGLDERLPFVVRNFPWLPGISDLRESFNRVRATIEPQVNGSLSRLLAAFTWPVTTVGVPIPKEQAEAMSCSLPLENVQGPAPSPASGKAKGQAQPDDSTAKGTVYSASLAKIPARTRAIFVSDPTPERPWSIRAAVVTRNDNAAPQCVAGAPILGNPSPETEPALAFDAELQYLVIRTYDRRFWGPFANQGSLNVHQLLWRPGPSADNPWLVSSQQLAVVQEGDDFTAFNAMLAKSEKKLHTMLPTWSSEAGTVVTLAPGKYRRLFSSSPVEVGAYAGAATQKVPDFESMDMNPAGEPCSRLNSALSKRKADASGTENLDFNIHTDGKFCLVVIRGKPTQGYAPANHEAVQVQVYLPPLGEPKDPDPISIVNFGLQPEYAVRWLLGTAGNHAGWIALDVSPTTDRQWLIGAPWSTAAIARLAREVPLPKPEPARPADAASANGARS